MKRLIPLGLVVVVLGLALLSCQTLSGVPFTKVTGGPANPPVETVVAAPVLTPPSNASIPPVAVPPGLDQQVSQDALVRLYESVHDGVVSIRVLTEEGTAQGSGFVIDDAGHIVTNYHVIENLTDLEVAFASGYKAHGEVIGTDIDSDLAIVKVDAPAEEIHPLVMGDSKQVQIGQTVVAIGNPFGLEGTMTTGIISAVGRSLPADETSLQSYTIPDIIQTDAPINPGNSGGILMDVQGQVLGVTSAIESPVRANAGVGFAIPAAIVKNVVPALIKDGKYVHSWLGISGTTLVPDQAKAMKLDASQRGALVEEVMPGSPAEKAGLRGSNQQVTIDGQPANVGGDVITAIDNQKVLRMDDLIAYLAGSTKVDQKVTLTILRDGKQQTLDVTLAARPTTRERANDNSVRGVRLGIAGTTVNEAIAKEMQLPSGQQGVIVEEVQPGSLAESAGLRGGDKTITLDGQQVNVGGDVITAVNGQPVNSIEELKAALSQLFSNQDLTLTVLRAGAETDITVHPGQ